MKKTRTLFGVYVRRPQDVVSGYSAWCWWKVNSFLGVLSFPALKCWRAFGEWLLGLGVGLRMRREGGSTDLRGLFSLQLHRGRLYSVWSVEYVALWTCMAMVSWSSS